MLLFSPQRPVTRKVSLIWMSEFFKHKFYPANLGISNRNMNYSNSVMPKEMTGIAIGAASPK